MLQTAAAETRNDVLLDVDGLKTYFFLRGGILKAVDGVSFQLRPHETLAIAMTVSRSLAGPQATRSPNGSKESRRRRRASASRRVSPCNRPRHAPRGRAQSVAGRRRRSASPNPSASKPRLAPPVSPPPTRQPQPPSSEPEPPVPLLPLPALELDVPAFEVVPALGFVAVPPVPLLPPSRTSPPQVLPLARHPCLETGRWGGYSSRTCGSH